MMDENIAEIIDLLVKVSASAQQTEIAYMNSGWDREELERQMTRHAILMTEVAHILAPPF